LVPLRPLALGEILDGGIDLLRRNPRATIFLGALAAALGQAIAIPVQLVTQNLTIGSSSIEEEPDVVAVFTEVLALSVSTLLMFLVSVTLSTMLSGILASPVANAVLGHPTSLEEVLSRLRARFWPLLGVGLVVAAATAVGLLLAGVGAIFVFVVTALAGPVVVLENAGVRQALRRSWYLTIGDFWRVLGVRALTMGVSFLMAFVLSVPFEVLKVVFGGSGFTGPAPLGSLLVTAVGAILGGAITSSFASCVDGLLYVDRRMRAEGLDIETAQLARAAADPTRAMAIS
jgi:hypothetical protein